MTGKRQIRAPAQVVDEKQNLFVIGSCYSFAQVWVEGALCIAQAALL